jgi:asparagine synthase (glutamine-hydrolysing)
MCGIAGFVNTRDDGRMDDARLTRMRDVIAHRGPDGAGLWSERNVGLAHRRLAIIDTAGGHQPMTNEDGRLWITFNGEIYNHAELRADLLARGHVYKTRSDTETILHLYEELGERAVDLLHGMFAFAIWDRRRRTLLLARDRLGIKPLYLARTDRELLFASEIKAIFASGVVSPSCRRDVLPEFLATRYLAGDQTFFDGVTRLPPGHTATWSAERGFETRRYWQVPATPETTTSVTFAEATSRVRAGLERAVQSHLMSDVPLGVFLSGGLDSSALAAIAARRHGGRLQTFAVGFAEKEGNELPYARLVADAIGAEHREVVVTPQQFFAQLPSLIWHEDEPIAFPSSVPLYFVSDLAKQHVKVVLTGEGSDELFLGYNRYRVTNWNMRGARAYAHLVPGALRRAARRRVLASPPRFRRYASRSFLALDPDPRSLFCENFSVFPGRLRDRILPDGSARDPHRLALEAFDAAGGSALDAMSRADLQTYLHELLMKQDQMSMAASIESRVPFLDDQLVAEVLALPAAFKVRGWTTKAVLREAVRDILPAPILTRRKMGFPTPIGRWLAGEFSHVVDEFVLGSRTQARGLFDAAAVGEIAREHRAGAGHHGDRLWLLINLEIWQRIFADGEAPADIMRAALRPGGRTHADRVDQNGRALAAHEWRPAAQFSHAAGAVAASPGRAGHH